MLRLLAAFLTRLMSRHNGPGPSEGRLILSPDYSSPEAKEARATAAAIRVLGYKDMHVTYSAGGEYTSSLDVE